MFKRLEGVCVGLSADYRLNPVLRKACKADIPKFCQPILNKATADGELEGQLISCLKLKYADQVRPCDGVHPNWAGLCAGVETVPRSTVSCCFTPWFLFYFPILGFFCKKLEHHPEPQSF